MNLQDTLSNYVKEAVKSTYDASLETVEFQATRKEFAGCCRSKSIQRC